MANFDNTSALAYNMFVNKKAEMEANGVQLDERTEAALFAQCIETQVLKAPATAVFPNLNEMIVNGSNGNYAVSGFVDSQNSYGAMIRTKYTYNVENINGTWVCKNNFVDAGQQAAKKAGMNAVGWFILISIIGLIFWFIEMGSIGLL